MELTTSQHPTMSSTEMAEITNTRPDSVKRTMESLEKKGIITFTQSVEKGVGRPAEVYHVNKRDSLVVVARLSPEFTARVIDRWQELENKVPAIPQTYAEALQLAADQAKQLEEAKPKVEYHDKVLATTNGITTTEVAAELGMSAQKLNKLLESMKVQRKIGGRWVLTAANIGKGYDVEITHVDDGGVSRHAMKWSEKGRKFIHELVGE